MKVDKHIIVANCGRYSGRGEMKRLKAIGIAQNPLLKCVLCHFVSVEVVDKILVAAMIGESARAFYTGLLCHFTVSGNTHQLTFL